MTFNEEELLKIQRATSGFLKRRAREDVSATLYNLGSSMRSRFDNYAYDLEEGERETLLKGWLEEATAERKRALQAGATGYGDPYWAPAAACESWLLEILNGTPESISRVEKIVSEMIEVGWTENAFS